MVRVYDGELIWAYGCGVLMVILCIVLSCKRDLCSEVPGSPQPCFALDRVTTLKRTLNLKTVLNGSGWLPNCTQGTKTIILDLEVNDLYLYICSFIQE